MNAHAHPRQFLLYMYNSINKGLVQDLTSALSVVWSYILLEKFIKERETHMENKIMHAILAVPGQEPEILELPAVGLQHEEAIRDVLEGNYGAI